MHLWPSRNLCCSWDRGSGRSWALNWPPRALCANHSPRIWRSLALVSAAPLTSPLPPAAIGCFLGESHLLGRLAHCLDSSNRSSGHRLRCSLAAFTCILLPIQVTQLAMHMCNLPPPLAFQYEPSPSRHATSLAASSFVLPTTPSLKDDQATRQLRQCLGSTLWPPNPRPASPNFNPESPPSPNDEASARESRLPHRAS